MFEIVGEPFHQLLRSTLDSYFRTRNWLNKVQRATEYKPYPNICSNFFSFCHILDIIYIFFSVRRYMLKSSGPIFLSFLHRSNKKSFDRIFFIPSSHHFDVSQDVFFVFVESMILHHAIHRQVFSISISRQKRVLSSMISRSFSFETCRK